MKRHIALIILLSTSTTSFAGDQFSDRVSRASKLEASPIGLNYLMGFMQHVDLETTKMMSDCFLDGPEGAGPMGSSDKFTLVADIQQDGSITDVEVQPSNAKTLCYAEKFGHVKAPIPPSKFHSGFPIVIHTEQKY